MSDAKRLETLVAATGLDPHTARQRLVRGTPQVTMLIQASLASTVVSSLSNAGVSAFAPTDADLAAAPAPLRVKRLVSPEGSPFPMYLAELWKGDPEGLRCDDVELLVRARIDQSTVRTIIGSDPSGFNLVNPMMLGVGPTSLMTAAGMDLHGGMPAARTTTSHESRHLVDLFTRDGRRLRCDSSKFNFDVLGKDRGISDLQSTERLALRLAEECQHAQIDTGFREFRCTGDIIASTARSLGGTTIVKRDESPVFEFYSAWSYCLFKAFPA
jgi:hypothetical protein